MIIIYDDNGNKNVDNRHVVDIDNSYSFADAIVINEDGTYDRVTYMIDDVRTYNNEVIIDATEEEKEAYRKHKRHFIKGDKVKINRGRKMLGDIKIVDKEFTYRPNGTYGHQDVEYLVFTDGTKVNKRHCDFTDEEKVFEDKIVYRVDYEYIWRTHDMDWDEYNTDINSEWFDTYEEAIEYVRNHGRDVVAVYKCKGHENYGGGFCYEELDDVLYDIVNEIDKQ